MAHAWLMRSRGTLATNDDEFSKLSISRCCSKGDEKRN
jgi:hypothetical protein